MRGRRDPKPKRVPRDYPESFVTGFMARTLPTTTPTEAASAVRHLRSKGWTEEQLAKFILPYMPHDAAWTPAAALASEAEPPGARPAANERPPPRTPLSPRSQPPQPSPILPADVTRAWLDGHLSAMDRRELRLVVDELERRGWPTGTVAMVVLPHLIPKLPADDARAVIAGLRDLGMTREEIACATSVR